MPGQDEATVRPYATNGQPVPDGGMCVVRAAFTLAGSARREGYLYYPPELPLVEIAT